MDGFYLIDKEKGMTSYDLIRKLNKKFGKQKFGHLGTLDPLATGLMIIAANQGTKLIHHWTKNSHKEYIATVKLGIQTTTGDITGETLVEAEVPVISDSMLKEAFNKFLGTSEQLPPIYSAKKVNGKKLYEYARENKEVVIKKHPITVYEIKLLEILNESEFVFQVEVSKGTYIRSLIEDIAKELKTVGTMKELRRTKSDDFEISNASTISELEISDIITLEKLAQRVANTHYVLGDEKRLAQNGFSFKPLKNIEYPVAYLDSESEKLIAIYEKINDEKSKPFLVTRNDENN